MENLDALLEDLRVTKQHVLQQSSPTPNKNGNTNGSSNDFRAWTPTALSRLDVSQSRNSLSMPRRPLQENLKKLDRILNDLDEIEVQTKGFEPQTGNANDSHSRNSNRFVEPDSRTHDHKSANGIGDAFSPMSQKTKEAAAHASRQLDELMTSLQLLKLQQQPAPSNVVITGPPYNQFNRPEHSPSTQRGPLLQQASSCVENVTSNGSDFRNQTPEGGLPYPTESNGNHMPPTPSNGLPTTSQASFRGSHCLQCGQPVVGKIITALGGVWHPDHFNCASCQKNVVEEYFYEHEGSPYCTDCHLALFAPKCAFCGEAIVERCLEAMGYFWHPDHFFCQGCHTPFVDNATAHEHQGKVFCPNCYYSRFGERCGGCRKPILNAYVTALDQPWHEECFKCKDCGMKLSGREFYAENGYLYCEKHHHRNAGMICAACQELIVDNRCINALGLRYHPQHFVCTYCLRQLSTGTFKEHHSKPYCDPCFRQLFG